MKLNPKEAPPGCKAVQVRLRATCGDCMFLGVGGDCPAPRYPCHADCRKDGCQVIYQPASPAVSTTP